MRIWVMGAGIAAVVFVATLARGPFIDQTAPVVAIPFDTTTMKGVFGGLGPSNPTALFWRGDRLEQLFALQVDVMEDMARVFPGKIGYFYVDQTAVMPGNDRKGLVCAHELSVLEKFVPTWVGCYPAIVYEEALKGKS